MGKDIRSSILVEGSAAADHGQLQAVSPLDGVERFVSFRRVGRLSADRLRSR